MPGFISLSLSRSIESPSTYLLLVEWETLEDHTEGFRGSPEYQQWRALLHRFYEPFPVVEHYNQVMSARPADLRGRRKTRPDPWAGRRNEERPPRESKLERGGLLLPPHWGNLEAD